MLAEMKYFSDNNFLFKNDKVNVIGFVVAKDSDVEIYKFRRMMPLEVMWGSGNFQK